MKKRYYFLFGSLVLILWVAGSVCFGGLQSIDIEKDILEQLKPLEFKKVVSMNLGAITMFLLNGVLEIADDSDEDSDSLEGITKIQLGVYELVGDSDMNPAENFSEISGSLEARGWELFVKVREKDEHVLIYYALEDEKLSAMLAVVLDHTELVVVVLKGNVDTLIQQAIEDQGLDIEID